MFLFTLMIEVCTQIVYRGVFSASILVFSESIRHLHRVLLPIGCSTFSDPRLMLSCGAGLSGHLAANSS